MTAERFLASYLERPDGTIVDPGRGDLRACVESGTPFWLDVEDPSDELIDLLGVALHLHPLAVEDSKTFGQRGKLQVYGDVAMMVGFGFRDGEPIEVHAYYTQSFIITLRRSPIAALDGLRATGEVRALLTVDPIRVLHALVTALHAPFRPFIEEIDDSLDRLEEQVLDDPSDDQLIEIARVKQRATALRRTLTPGRDNAYRSTTVPTMLPGATADTALYITDISDELQLIISDLTAIIDRCAGMLALHSSLTSNRQGDAGRQLAIIATVFLPITFVVGFFGMNFSALVDDIQTGWAAFLALGIGLNVACILATLAWLRRRDLG